jgi:hypothetical protein
VKRDTAPQIPLLIGVTGHRDLVLGEMGPLRDRVREWLVGLRARFADAPLQLLTSLSPGADLLVAEEALGIGLDCIAVLPFPVETYRTDFAGVGELERFERALAACRKRLVCPLGKHLSLEEIEAPGPARTAQYAAAGEAIASAVFILLALWDGRPSRHGAGTAQTVEFRLRQRAWLGDESRPVHQELMPNLPPDCVYHIVTSRAASGPAEGLMPLQAGYRSRPDGPFEADLPHIAALIWTRTAELNRALKLHTPEIERRGADTTLIGELAEPPANVTSVARLFSAIDFIATRMRRAVLLKIYWTALLSSIMGGSILLYGHSDPESLWQRAIYVFLGAFLLLIAGDVFARSRHLQRRHLEARALAEGLRVQLFWAIAGVQVAGATPSAHRSILKQADPGLEWIPNALRAASLFLLETRHAGLPGGVDFAIRHWIGSNTASGSCYEQLDYFWRASRRRAVHAVAAEAAVGTSIAIGLLVTFVLVLAPRAWVHENRTPLIFLIGFLPLFAGVLETSLQTTAGRELRRQYEYMYEVFRNARDRLLRATSDVERRSILSLLGHAALAEHAGWLFLHRDRRIDRSTLQ